MKFQAQGRAGFSVVSLMVITTILAAISTATVRFLSNSFIATRQIQSKVDLASVKAMLARDLDCMQTLPAVPPAGGCTPTNYLALRGRTGALLTNTIETSGPFYGSGRLGELYLRATCDTASQTIVVNVAMAGSAGGFRQDPTYKDTLDFANLRLNPIYGPAVAGKPAVPLCNFRFAPPTATSCAAGWYASSVNFDTRTINCQPLPAIPPPAPTPSFGNCPPNHVQVGNYSNGLPNCAPKSGQAGGAYMRFTGDAIAANGGNPCWIPNPATGGCNCPGGFQDTLVFAWAAHPIGPGYQPYCNSPVPMTATCGAEGHVCFTNP